MAQLITFIQQNFHCLLAFLDNICVCCCVLITFKRARASPSSPHPSAALSLSLSLSWCVKRGASNTGSDFLLERLVVSPNLQQKRYGMPNKLLHLLLCVQEVVTPFI